MPPVSISARWPGLHPLEVGEADGLPAALPPADAIGLLQHSSGTTGLKKGVALSYRAIAAQMDSYGASIGIDADDCIVSWLPLYHDMGLMACFVIPVYFGVTLVHLDPFHWLAQPARLFAEIEERRGTLTWLPNFAFEHLANIATEHRYDLASMRAFIDCSEPCRKTSLVRFAESFAPFGVRPEMLQICYAMAETVFAAAQTPMGGALAYAYVDRSRLEIGSPAPLTDEGAPGASVVADVGRPLAGAEINIHDLEGRALPDGVVGEIAIRGDFLFEGYYKDPERSRDRLRDGWYHTRDLGFRLNGGLFVLGRLDDVIIVNGKNLLAHDIEAVINTVQGVKPGRAVAMAMFDERNGSDVLLVMAETIGDAAASLRREIVERIYAHVGIKPFDVRLVPANALIKTSSGKISRKDNLARYLAAKAATKTSA